jgi:hypothetical protein
MGTGICLTPEVTRYDLVFKEILMTASGIEPATFTVYN